MIDKENYKYLDMFDNIFDGDRYITQGEIDKFEDENKVKLPKDYVDFILGLPMGDRYIDRNKGYGHCKSVSFKGITITSNIGELSGYGIYNLQKELMNGKEISMIGIGTTDSSEDFGQDFFMILDKEEYGAIYHDKFFGLAMHRMNIKVADSFTELLDNVLNGRDLPEDESDDFDMDEDDDECEYFTEEEKKLTHQIPYYF